MTPMTLAGFGPRHQYNARELAEFERWALTVPASQATARLDSAVCLRMLTPADAARIRRAITENAARRTTPTRSK